MNRAPLVAVAVMVAFSAGVGIWMDHQSRLDRRDHFGRAQSAPTSVTRQTLAEIPVVPRLLGSDRRVLAAYEVQGDRVVSMATRDPALAYPGLLAWQRLATLFPADYRREIAVWNVVQDKRLQGYFAQRHEFVEERFVQPRSYRIALSRAVLLNEPGLGNVGRAPVPLQGSLDWVLAHEMAHYITRRNGAIQAFAERFGAPDRTGCLDFAQQTVLPLDDVPVFSGSFVTLYACTGGVVEDVAESLATYLLVASLPDVATLAADKTLFFEQFAGLPALRAHIQQRAGSRD